MEFFYIVQEIIIFDVDCTALVQQIEHASCVEFQQVDNFDIIREVKILNSPFKTFFLESIPLVHKDLL